MTLVKKNLNALPSLREEMAHFGIKPTKALGQNFLLDQNITDKIARLAQISENDHVIEVGPGPGGLTRSLLKTGASVTAIEKDTHLLRLLARLKECAEGQFEFINDDALKFDISTHQHHPENLKIVANLPYNVATPLLTRWLSTDWPPNYASMTLMFQKEVADRIVARPGEKAYGRLAILSQWRCHTDIVMSLPPEAFTPPPKVNSAVVHFTPKQLEDDIKVKDLEAITQAVFHQRRKKIRTGLKSMFKNVDATLAEVGIDPNCRGETLDIPYFLKLAQAYALEK